MFKTFVNFSIFSYHFFIIYGPGRGNRRLNLHSNPFLGYSGKINSLGCFKSGKLGTSTWHMNIAHSGARCCKPQVRNREEYHMFAALHRDVYGHTYGPVDRALVSTRETE